MAIGRYEGVKEFGFEIGRGLILFAKIWNFVTIGNC